MNTKIPQELTQITDLTETQIATAVTDVLKQFGTLITKVQGTKEHSHRVIGSVSLIFYEDGQYGYSFGGFLSKAVTMGALSDVLLEFRDFVKHQEMAEQVKGMCEASMLQAKDLN